MFNALSLYWASDDEWEPRVCQIKMPDGSTKGLNTWAPYLVGTPIYPEFAPYSETLRTLIARCMAHHRQDRPSLKELLDTIEQAIAQGDTAADEAQRKWNEEKRKNPNAQKSPVDIRKPPSVEDDDLLRRFFQDYFRDPPIREDPYTDHWG
ncbi:uncharacterized protein F4822DRAFT_396980 [Hypoxylon trugodes]|uniref:uncharacterized protein n=1 Tax=Hypoxylon trugodes TaxID=326681 RepID=UPI00219078EF|nr:uncharacterized protein F4822DRAFT_396980 [Hypoxylon trugodes]KAI1391517.1 hypothetical protein F4822DRAFT_396980 [Hypoxylon trugodes]